jgi:Raf kinase inhibitor-like YbhB/YbcL family protein
MIVLVSCLFLFACGTNVTELPAPQPTLSPVSKIVPASTLASTEALTKPFTLASSAFANGGSIPARYSCLGEEASPPLEWSEPPAGVKSFALIMDDPDASMGTWVHWVLYNIPITAQGWPENTPNDAELVNGAMQGKNSGGRIGYGGPCPPSGTHHYFIRLYALDTMLDPGSGVNKEQLLSAMQGHVLAQSELIGVFSK